MDVTASDGDASLPACSEAAPGRCVDSIAIGAFSLVAYLPEPLAGFIGELRLELEPGCRARPHVTLFPPRQLPCSSDPAFRNICDALHDFRPFWVEFGEVRFFPETSVVYLSLTRGSSELEQVHRMLTRGLRGAGIAMGEEVYPYHPHLTLAQRMDPGAMAAAGELVSRRWGQFPHSRGFMLDALTFVQKAADDVWLDLAEVPLGTPLGV